MVDTHRTPARAWNPDLARLCLVIIGSMAENAQDWRFKGLSCSDYHYTLLAQYPGHPLINFPKPTFRASWGLSLTSATYGGKTANPVRLPTTRHRPLS